MSDPVMSKRGQNYDRQFILQWFKRGNTNCPLTRQPLLPSQLVSNNALKKSIEQWRTEKGLERSEEISPRGDEEDSKIIGFFNVEPEESSNSEADNDDLNYLLNLYNEVLDISESG